MRNPIRRSRKIGKTQGGRVKAGRAIEKMSRWFTQTTWERLSAHTGELLIIRENPSKGHLHPCRSDEVRQVLQKLPTSLTEDIRAVVLRRLPQRDETNGVEARKRYQCIILNAFPRNLEMPWRRKPPEAVLRHYAPWCNEWVQKGSSWILQWDMASLRHYYLYHLLLHEVGHFNHPFHNSWKRREDSAEDFALTWARRLGALE